MNKKNIVTKLGWDYSKCAMNLILGKDPLLKYLLLKYFKNHTLNYKTKN